MERRLRGVQLSYVDPKPVEGILVKDVNTASFVHEDLCHPHVLHHHADHQRESASFYDMIRMVATVEGDWSFKPMQVEWSSWGGSVDLPMR